MFILKNIVLLQLTEMMIFVLICVMFVSSLEAHNAHLSSAQKEKVQQYTAECVKETGVKREVLAEAKMGHLSEDEGLKEFIFCFFQKSGLLSPDAKLNIEVALSKLPKDIDKVAAEKILNECKNKTGKNNADTAFQIFKCYHKATKQHVLFE